MALPVKKDLLKRKKEGEYYVRIILQLKDKLPWAREGHEVAFEHFRLPAAITQPVKHQEKKRFPGIHITKNDGQTLVLEGKKFRVSFDKQSGLLNEYVYNGKKRILPDGLQPGFWRPQTDNDRRGGKTQKTLAAGKKHHTTAK